MGFRLKVIVRYEMKKKNNDKNIKNKQQYIQNVRIKIEKITIITINIHIVKKILKKVNDNNI